MARKVTEHGWTPSQQEAAQQLQQQQMLQLQQHHSASPRRLPATPPSASLFGSSTTLSAGYPRPPYSSQQQQQQQQQQHQQPMQQSVPHPGLSTTHQRLPPIPIQPYTTPPPKTGQRLPPIHSPHPYPPYHHHHHPYSLPPPPSPPHPPPPATHHPTTATPTPAEPSWDLRQLDISRLDEPALRKHLHDAVSHIQSLTGILSATKTALAQANLQNTLLRTESREISQRSAVETELAKREVEVLLREYAAQMPSANQLANTYYRRYRGLKRRVKDLEAALTGKEAEIKKLQEYVRDSGISMPREPGKRTRRTGLKYAPRGGAWAAVPPPSGQGSAGATVAKERVIMPRTLKPAPNPAVLPTSGILGKSETSQESQSSGLDALGMLASQYLDSQESTKSRREKHFPPPSSQPTSSQFIPSTPYETSSQPKGPLLSPLPLPPKRRRAGSHASNSSTEHDPGITESEKSPTKVRVMGDSDDEEIVAIKESPPSSGYANAVPLPYRARVGGARTNGPDLITGGPRRRLDFEGGDSGGKDDGQRDG